MAPTAPALLWSKVLGWCAVLLLFPWFSATADDMTSTLIIGGSRIDVTIESGNFKASQTDLLHWVQSASEAIATYYGRYPIPRVAIRIIPFAGSGVRHGQTFGYDGGFIKIRVGTETPAAELAEDWMLTHEMVHLSFPSVAEQHHWIEEGLATYVEPIARIQAKQMDAPQMWADLARDMPKGVPQHSDKGLDHTHTWASTYWGGALFCFLADVEIRRQTQNQKGLQDALRGILNAGGDIRQDWNLEDTLKAGDRATGTLVPDRQGRATAYSIENLQPRGALFLSPGDEVYEGMVIGEHARGNDLDVNVTKEKKLSNMRASGSDDMIRLIPPRLMNLEQALEFIRDDELVEVTPAAVRLRKRVLAANRRK